LVLSGYGPLGRNQDNKKTKDLLRLRRGASHLLIPEVIFFKRFPKDLNRFGIKPGSSGFIFIGLVKKFEPVLNPYPAMVASSFSSGVICPDYCPFLSSKDHYR
jgi:hypothetical protein